MKTELIPHVMKFFDVNEPMAIFIIVSVCVWGVAGFLMVRVGFHAMHFNTVEKRSQAAIDISTKTHEMFIKIHLMLLTKNR